MTPASELTISAAVAQFRVSRKTIRRRLADGSLEGARQRQGDHGPEWVFPAESLERLGYERRDQVPADSTAATGKTRAPGRTAVAVGVLLLLCIGAFVGYAFAGLADDEEPESADPAWAVLAEVTEQGDEVGVVGSGVSTAVPSGRIPVPIDDVAGLDDAPRYVVVGPDAPDDVVALLASDAAPLLALGSPARSAWVFDRAAAGSAAVSSTSPAVEASTTTSLTTTSTTPSTTTATTASSTTTASTTTTTTTGGADAPVSTDPEPPLEADPPDGSAETGSITVGPGDNFWSIAEDVVGEAAADSSLESVTQYWAALVDANLDRLVDPGNPDLIVPGQVLTLPSP